MSATVLIMAGGTGGHIYPGLAVAAALKEAGASVSWLGASGGMECGKVPAHGIELDVVRISALRGKGLTSWLTLPFRLAHAVVDAARIIRTRRPDCAVSFGGYVAGPGGIAAWLKGVPLIVHEQNRIPGLTNKALAKIARQVLQAFPDTFPERVRALSCGNPVRNEVASLPSPEKRWSQRAGPARLLVTGGSQGAQALNVTLPEAIASLPVSENVVVRHQTGEAGQPSTAAAYEARGIQAEVTAFIDDMAAAYDWADLVVCRAGALTISELAAAGIGSVLVPFPHAVDDHQTANAHFLSDTGAAALLPETDLTADSLSQIIEPLLLNRDKSLAMACQAHSQAVPNSATTVANACLECIAA